MTVERVTDVTPHMRRVTLSGSDLGRYATNGSHLMLFVPSEGIAKPEWPVPGEDCLPVWSADDRRPQVRTCTVRRLDPEAGTIDVDFVLHGDLGSRWALNARPGDVIGVRGPTGRHRPEVDWCLLVGDETALPVIARTLESLQPPRRDSRSSRSRTRAGSSRVCADALGPRAPGVDHLGGRHGPRTWRCGISWLMAGAGEPAGLRQAVGDHVVATVG